MKLYDSGKIITGIVIFVILMTFPFWFNMGRAAPKPDPKLPKNVKNCVLPKDTIKTSHMQILNNWRDEVVRDSKRSFVAFDGKHFDKSLSNTCMKCHSSKKQFCDQCHNYLKVTPYCWDCHIEPKEPKESKETAEAKEPKETK
ncbi:MAG: sulfate reduction electron transfer complex DsrMKJOP subunit DsrJ [Deltaproteobacteria bacterium]|nr:sulfate reduction electron transfer complex DsrMKJOP subunit DsrJ [Deltaproteobacteria bacterium]